MPAGYEQAPAAVLLVPDSIPQAEVIEAIWALTGRPMLDRLHAARDPSADRFPRADYARLTDDARSRVHQLIRQLADGHR